ncbi:NPXTG-anchored protein [Ruminococcus sp.]|uniref:NPXTG-anchored protein n=1 Tax=Ruminococcus sp. TaxID=41978 RepID=UPI0025D568C0|nr:NPXTG-anchored protein [Ruminococcus sp.]MCR4640064.1 NPXTG-anchored protein [Ruminococcus sp.]
MKKTIAMAAALLISCSAVCMTSFAADETKVYVTITDDKKDLVLVQEPVTVTDIDSDGKLTVNDALYIAHENKYEGGAAAGYKSSAGQWGLGLDKLWGVENGGSYGYYVNDNMAMGLTDEVKNNDQLQAFVYPDPKDYNYNYSYFDAKDGGEKGADSEVTLTLSYVYFDENYAPKSKALEGASITVNGKETEYKTDSEGKATIKLTESGKNIISAVGSSVNIVPPVYIVNVNGESAVTTTLTEATTTTTTTTTAATTTTTTATTSKTTAKTTTAARSNSPKTGVKGAGLAVFGLAGAAATAFALRRKNEE